MTQAELASRIHSSQPRIAKAESGDGSVSIELLLRAMLATGATPQEIGHTIADTVVSVKKRPRANSRATGSLGAALETHFAASARPARFCVYFLM